MNPALRIAGLTIPFCALGIAIGFELGAWNSFSYWRTQCDGPQSFIHFGVFKR
jgi:hypothetical protein